MKRFCLFFVITLINPAWAADPGMDALITLLAQTQDIQAQQDLLRGLNDGLADRRRAPMPTGWTDLYAQLSRSADPEVSQLALRLALKFGDPQADKQLRATVIDINASAPQRIQAMEALIDRQDPKLPPLLIQGLDDRAVQSAAARGLAAFNHPQTAEALISRYAAFDAPHGRMPCRLSPRALPGHTR